jgi:predicted DNA-binding transcriptional regulator AlpA
VSRQFVGYPDFPAKGIKYSKAHIWRLRQLPATDPRKFPDPVKGLGPEDTYREDEIDEYIEARVAERDRRAADQSERNAPAPLPRAAGGVTVTARRYGRRLTHQTNHEFCPAEPPPPAARLSFPAANKATRKKTNDHD